VTTDRVENPWKPQPSAPVGGAVQAVRSGPVRNGLACAAATALIFGQLILFGANTDVLAAAFAGLELLVALFVVWLLRAEPREALWRAIGVVGAIFAAALAWAAIPVLLRAAGLKGFDSAAPDGPGLEMLKLAGVAATVLIGALVGASRTRLRLLVYWLVIGGLAYTLLTLWAGRAAPFTVWGQPKGAHMWRFTGSFLNANAAGCLFGMLGLLALSLTRYRLSRTDLARGGLRDYLLIALAVAAAFAAFGACALTQSRTALVLSLILGGLMIVLTRLGDRSSKPVLIVIAVLLVAGLVLGASQIGSRWEMLSADFGVRLIAAGHFLSLVGERPWFGYGLGSFQAVHLAHLPPPIATSIWNFGAAHLAVAQAALEGGIPYLLLLAAAIAVMVAPIARTPENGRARGVLAQGAAAASLLAFLCSFGDIALNVPAVTALAALLLGAVWSNAVSAE
jgi:O-antigen ligase